MCFKAAGVLSIAALGIVMLAVSISIFHHWTGSILSQKSD
jgi:hypothetical protein